VLARKLNIGQLLSLEVMNDLVIGKVEKIMRQCSCSPTEPRLGRSGLRRQSNTQPHPGKATARFMFEVSMLESQPDVASSSPGCKDFCGPSW
jgi:hypothetical protein